MGLETNTVSMIGRRRFLTSAAGAACVISLVPVKAWATPEEVQAEISKLVGGRTIKNDERIVLTLPEIAENGNTVPLTLSVDSPMSAQDHVTALHIFCDGNPLPGVASYFLGPHNGKAEITMRIRLMQTQKVVAVAELSSGEVLRNQAEIKVTLGGCGG